MKIIIQAIFIIVFCSNLQATFVIRKGDLSDFSAIAELEKNRHAILKNGIDTDSFPKPQELSILLTSSSIFNQWLKTLQFHIFEKKFLDFMVCYKKNEADNSFKLIGYCTFFTKNGHAYLDSCYFCEDVIDGNSFVTALSVYTFQFCNGIKLMFAADLFPTEQNSLFTHHKDSFIKLGFFETDLPEALIYTPGEKEQSNYQGYMLSLEAVWSEKFFFPDITTRLKNHELYTVINET